MFISLLIVGIEQETNQPIQYLAGWSLATVTAFCCSILCLVLSRRRSLVTEQPAQAALMTI